MSHTPFSGDCSLEIEADVVQHPHSLDASRRSDLKAYSLISNKWSRGVHIVFFYQLLLPYTFHGSSLRGILLFNFAICKSLNFQQLNEEKPKAQYILISK